MNWNGKQVLVTGGGGFIGSHLTEKLVQSGAKVRAMVRYNGPGRRGWLDKSPHVDSIDIVSGDITDPGFVRHSMENCDCVFHLAALIAIPYSYVAPTSYVQTNVCGTLNVLEAGRLLNTPKIIHTSTSEVYGTAQTVPISESHPLQGQSPYSASKIGADKIVESFYCSFDSPVVTVRPFNTFGPRQSARAVLPTIIAQCLKGDIVKLGALTPTRDLNYVENTAGGFIRAAEVEQAVGATVNLGTGKEISIGDLAHLIADIMGKKITIECENERLRPEKSEVNRLLADNTLAKELLNWEPEISFREGLQRTIDWFSKPDNLANYRADVYNV